MPGLGGEEVAETTPGAMKVSKSGYAIHIAIYASKSDTPK